MNHLLRIILCCCTLLTYNINTSNAGHMFGTSIKYSYVGGSTYSVSVTMYADCRGLQSNMLENRAEVLVYDGTKFVDTIHLPIGTIDTGSEVGSLCSLPTVTQCYSYLSDVPGIKKYSYNTLYAFPHSSASWRFIYIGYNATTQYSGRSEGNTNIMFTDDAVRVEAMLNSIAGNTSVSFNNDVSTYYCINQHASFIPAAVDTDGDSLSFQLTAPISTSRNYLDTDDYYLPVSYVYPYSAQLPLATNPSDFSYSQATGAMAFTPNKLQRSMVGYNIEEYRGGILVGSSRQEMTILVKSCSDPCSLGNAIINHTNAINIFPNPANQKVTISLNGTDYNQLTIANVLGQVVLSQDISGWLTTIPVDTLVNGMYYITLWKGNEKRGQQIAIMH